MGFDWGDIVKAGLGMKPLISGAKEEETGTKFVKDDQGQNLTIEPPGETKPRSFEINLDRDPDKMDIEELYFRFSNAETAGQEDPWIRTKVRPSTAKESSTAYGPVQMTKTKVEDYLKRGILKDDPDLEAWVQEKFIPHADQMRKHGLLEGQKAESEDFDPRFDYGGSGDFKDADKRMYRKLAYKLMGHDVTSSKSIDEIIKKWRGKDPELDYSERFFGDIKDWRYKAKKDPKVQAWWGQLQQAYPDLEGADLESFMEQGSTAVRPDGYDYRGAIESGALPELDPESGELHWPSRNPLTGALLKGPEHPTIGKELDLQEKQYGAIRAEKDPLPVRGGMDLSTGSIYGNDMIMTDAGLIRNPNLPPDETEKQQALKELEWNMANVPENMLDDIGRQTLRNIVAGIFHMPGSVIPMSKREYLSNVAAAPTMFVAALVATGGIAGLTTAAAAGLVGPTAMKFAAYQMAKTLIRYGVFAAAGKVWDTVPKLYKNEKFMLGMEKIKERYGLQAFKEASSYFAAAARSFGVALPEAANVVGKAGQLLPDEITAQTAVALVQEGVGLILQWKAAGASGKILDAIYFKNIAKMAPAAAVQAIKNQLKARASEMLKGKNAAAPEGYQGDMLNAYFTESDFDKLASHYYKMFMQGGKIVNLPGKAPEIFNPSNIEHVKALNGKLAGATVKTWAAGTLPPEVMKAANEMVYQQLHSQAMVSIKDLMPKPGTLYSGVDLPGMMGSIKETLIDFKIDPATWKRVEAGDFMALPFKALEMLTQRMPELAGEIEKSRERKAPTFYLKSAKIIEEKMGQSMPVKELENMLKNAGLKEEELKHTGIQQFLENKAGQDKITKEDILAEIQANALEVREKLMGEDVPKGQEAVEGDWEEGDVRDYGLRSSDPSSEEILEYLEGTGSHLVDSAREVSMEEIAKEDYGEVTEDGEFEGFVNEKDYEDWDEAVNTDAWDRAYSDAEIELRDQGDSVWFNSAAPDWEIIYKGSENTYYAINRNSGDEEYFDNFEAAQGHIAEQGGAATRYSSEQLRSDEAFGYTELVLSFPPEMSDYTSGHWGGIEAPFAHARLNFTWRINRDIEKQIDAALDKGDQAEADRLRELPEYKEKICLIEEIQSDMAAKAKSEALRYTDPAKELKDVFSWEPKKAYEGYKDPELVNELSQKHQQLDASLENQIDEINKILSKYVDKYGLDGAYIPHLPAALEVWGDRKWPKGTGARIQWKRVDVSGMSEEELFDHLFKDFLESKRATIKSTSIQAVLVHKFDDKDEKILMKHFDIGGKNKLEMPLVGAMIEGVNRSPENLPFIRSGNWIPLTIKRLVRYAAEKGAHRIAWIDGYQTAARWEGGLVSTISRLEYNKKTGKLIGRYDAYMKVSGSPDGPIKYDEKVQLKSLDNIMDPRVAQMIKDSPGDEVVITQFPDNRSELRIAKPWPFTIYDSEIPKNMGKIGSKYGLKVEPYMVSNLEYEVIEYPATQPNIKQLKAAIEKQDKLRLTLQSGKLVAADWTEEWERAEQETPEVSLDYYIRDVDGKSRPARVADLPAIESGELGLVKTVNGESLLVSLKPYYKIAKADYSGDAENKRIVEYFEKDMFLPNIPHIQGQFSTREAAEEQLRRLYERQRGDVRTQLSLKLNGSLKYDALYEGFSMYKKPPKDWDQSLLEKEEIDLKDKEGMALLEKYMPGSSKYVKQAHRIFDKDGEDALGSFRPGEGITVKHGEDLSVYIHEGGHFYLYLFHSPEEISAFFDEVRKFKGNMALTDRECEEIMMEGLEEWERAERLGHEFKMGGKKPGSKIREFIAALWEKIQKFFIRQPKKVRKLYEEILKSKRKVPRDVDWTKGRGVDLYKKRKLFTPQKEQFSTEWYLQDMREQVARAEQGKQIIGKSESGEFVFGGKGSFPDWWKGIPKKEWQKKQILEGKLKPKDVGQLKKELLNIFDKGMAGKKLTGWQKEAWDYLVATADQSREVDMQVESPEAADLMAAKQMIFQDGWAKIAANDFGKLSNNEWGVILEVLSDEDPAVLKMVKMRRESFEKAQNKVRDYINKQLKALEQAPIMSVGEVKTVIRQETGQIKVSDLLEMSEKDLLNETLRAQERGSRFGLKEGKRQERVKAAQEMRALREKIAKSAVIEEKNNLKIKLKAMQSASQAGYRFGKKEGVAQQKLHTAIKEARERVRKAYKQKIRKMAENLRGIKVDELHPDFKYKVKELMEGLDFKKRTKKSLAWAKNMIENIMGDPRFDLSEDVVAKAQLIAGKSIHDLSYDEFQALHDMVMHYAALSKEAQQAIIGKHKLKVELAVKEANRLMDKVKKLKGIRGDMSESKWKKTKRMWDNIVETFGIRQEHPDLVLETILGGTDNVLYDVLFSDVNKGQQAAIEYTLKTEEAFARGLEKIPWKDYGVKDIDKWLRETIELNLPDQKGLKKISRANLLTLAAHIFCPENRQAILDGGIIYLLEAERPIYRMSEEDMLQIVSKLSKAEQEYVNLTIPLFKDQWEALNKVKVKTTGVELGDVYRYYPLRRYVAGQDEHKSLLEAFKDKMVRIGLFKGMLKDRVKNKNSVVISPIDQVLAESVHNSAAYIGLEEVLKTASSVLYHPDFKSAVINRFGVSTYKYLKEYLTDMALDNTELTSLETIFMKVKNRITPAILGANLWVMLKQLPSMVMYAIEVPAMDLLKSLFTYVTSGNTWKHGLKNRHAENSPLYKERRGKSGERDVADVMRRGVARHFTDKKKSLGEMAMAGITLFDENAVAIGMEAAINFKLREIEKDPKLSKLSPDEKVKLAYEYADEVTSKTQPMFQTQFRSSISRGSVFEKTITWFSTQLNMNLNMLKRTYREGLRTGKWDKFVKAVIIIGIINSAMITGINKLRDLTYGRKRKKKKGETEEDFKQRMVGEFVSDLVFNNMAMLYGIRDISGIIQRYFFQGSGFGLTLSNAFYDIITRGSITAAKVIEAALPGTKTEKRAKVAKQAFNEIFELALTARGIPFRTPWKTLKGLYRLVAPKKKESGSREFEFAERSAGSSDRNFEFADR